MGTCDVLVFRGNKFSLKRVSESKDHPKNNEFLSILIHCIISCVLDDSFAMKASDFPMHICTRLQPNVLFSKHDFIPFYHVIYIYMNL